MATIGYNENPAAILAFTKVFTAQLKDSLTKLKVF